jgi:hypothetical protein
MATLPERNMEPLSLWMPILISASFALFCAVLLLLLKHVPFLQRWVLAEVLQSSFEFPKTSTLTKHDDGSSPIFKTTLEDSKYCELMREQTSKKFVDIVTA